MAFACNFYGIAVDAGMMTAEQQDELMASIEGVLCASGEPVAHDHASVTEFYKLLVPAPAFPQLNPGGGSF